MLPTLQSLDDLSIDIASGFIFWDTSKFNHLFSRGFKQRISSELSIDKHKQIFKDKRSLFILNVNGSLDTWNMYTE